MAFRSHNYLMTTEQRAYNKQRMGNIITIAHISHGQAFTATKFFEQGEVVG